MFKKMNKSFSTYFFILSIILLTNIIIDILFVSLKNINMIQFKSHKYLQTSVYQDISIL